MNINDNPFLFLNKNKREIERYLHSQNAFYEYFPNEQKEQGYDALDCGNTRIWFDCKEIAFAQIINFDNKQKEIIKYTFDNIPITDLSSTAVILPLFEKIGKKYRTIENYNTNKLLTLFSFETAEYGNQPLVDIVVNDKEEIVSLAIQYSYSAYEYKKNIGLAEYLQNEFG